MASAELPDERGARSVAGHRLGGGGRDQRGRGPHSSTVRPGPVDVRHRPAGDVDSPAAAHETADQLQAEYFLRLLAQNRHHVDHRIGKYQKAIAAAEAAGDTEGANGLRRMACTEEEDRQTLDRLIENLRTRYPAPAPGERLVTR
jgi:hypothetical protein